MILQSTERLRVLCETIPTQLSDIEIHEFSDKPAPVQWSKKEILGHLIDSATNNHQRFVRGQFEHIPTIVYAQNNWNRYNYYQQMEGKQLIDF